MSLGMSYQDYWYGESWMARAYIDAERIKQKNARDRTNWSAHLAGRYVYEAICDASPLMRPFGKGTIKPLPYRDTPLDFVDEEPIEPTEEELEKKEQNEIAIARAYMMQMDMAGKNWGESI